MAMNATTPSDAAIAALLRGEPLSLSSGKVVVARLGANAKRLLGVLWSGRGDLAKRKPADQATHVRTSYAGASPPPSPSDASEPPAAPPGGSALRWRLHHLRCQSIRGIAPFGEVFEFPVGGESMLIYGPNGTGKSSLVNA